MAERLQHPTSPETVVEAEGERAEILRRRGYTPVGDSGTPNVSAKKAEWVDHAVSQGLDRDEAESLTKDELQERFG